MKPCDSIDPDYGAKCTMAEGHAGPHLIGSPYRPEIEWVVPCAGEAHKFHWNCKPDWSEFEQCIQCGLKRLITFLWDFSGGMESAAMVYLFRGHIQKNNGLVRWASTGKQFPEMEDSLKQIEDICQFKITRLQPPYSFDEYLFDRGGMLRQGFSDCSRRMKRKALRDHAAAQPLPQRIALGFNAAEIERGEDFCARNNKPGREFWYPLQDRDITRAETVKICQKAGFSILVGMYQKMGRFDCFFCPNQRISQAEKVMTHYPDLWAEWKDIEERKGHSILSISAKAIEGRAKQDDFMAALENKQTCSCMGGKDNYDDCD